MLLCEDKNAWLSSGGDRTCTRNRRAEFGHFPYSLQNVLGYYLCWDYYLAWHYILSLPYGGLHGHEDDQSSYASDNFQRYFHETSSAPYEQRNNEKSEKR